ncbi:hypothetical protein CSUI_007865 [Cystoisospora suis]|uniref:Uncharacterized protein n=1 Tax=Cystoisospora suis TaxID=483139 RepID=A0A2C6KNX2_9APIC|nr:hypothetical protein CSUI_007865 [Cystoisospora suis]
MYREIDKEHTFCFFFSSSFCYVCFSYRGILSRQKRRRRLRSRSKFRSVAQTFLGSISKSKVKE